MESVSLRRTARVSTSYGGRFVEAIDGVRGNRSGGWDWLYFVNGVEADRGAADYRLHPGDREWWDYRYWNDLIRTGYLGWGQGHEWKFEVCHVTKEGRVALEHFSRDPANPDLIQVKYETFMTGEPTKKVRA